MQETACQYVENLFSVFERQLIDKIDRSSFQANLEVIELVNSEKSIQEYGSKVNPSTYFKATYRLPTPHVKIRFSLYPSSHKNKDVGWMTVTLFDKKKIGTGVGDYLAFKNTQQEIGFLNPFLVNVLDFNQSLSKQLSIIFNVLNGDLYEILNGENEGIRGIPKKDWRDV